MPCEVHWLSALFIFMRDHLGCSLNTLRALLDVAVVIVGAYEIDNAVLVTRDHLGCSLNTLRAPIAVFSVVFGAYENSRSRRCGGWTWPQQAARRAAPPIQLHWLQRRSARRTVPAGGDSLERVAYWSEVGVRYLDPTRGVSTAY